MLKLSLFFATTFIDVSGKRLAICQVAVQFAEIQPLSLERLFSETEWDDAAQSSLRDAMRSKDLQRAEAILLEQLALDPASARAKHLLVFLGDVYYLNTDYTQAVVAWIKANAISPVDEQTRFQLATTEIHLGRQDLARANLKLLADANPASALYLYWLARLDYDAQQYASAIRHLEVAVTLEPGMARGYDLLGLCRDFQGDSKAAVRAYTIAVRLNRKASHPSSWPPLDMAVTLINANQLPEAVALLHEAIGDEPTNYKAHYELGSVEELLGELDRALDSYTEAVRLNAAYSEPHYALARLYRRLGKGELSKHEVEVLKQLRQQTSTPK